MSSVMAKYMTIQKRKFKHGWKVAKQSKICYLFCFHMRYVYTFHNCTGMYVNIYSFIYYKS